MLGSAEATDELEHRVQAVVTHSSARAAASSVPILTTTTPYTADQADRTLEFPAVVISPTDETGSIGSRRTTRQDPPPRCSGLPATPRHSASRPVPASSQQAADPNHQVAQPEHLAPRARPRQPAQPAAMSLWWRWHW